MDMDGNITQADLERGTLPPSLHVDSPLATGLGGPLKTGVASPLQSAQTSDSAVEEKFSLDDGLAASARSPTIDRVMDNFHRRDTRPLGQSIYGDPSAKIWGLYLSHAEKFDKEHSDSWTANTDGVLVFTGLFSATVASFILPSSSDATVQLLSQISQQLSSISNGTPFPAPATLLDSSSFQPTAAAVRVNTLWFISLAMSTACALWATLMQQWTRRYVQVADRPYAPPKRARIRAFFAEGVEKFGLAAAVEVLPALLHTSVLLFYIGLIDFLFNINHTVAYSLLSLVAFAVLIYFVLSIMPLYFHNSPYQTPLSSVLWFMMEATPLVRLWLSGKSVAVQNAIRDRRDRIEQGMRRALEKTASSLTWKADAHALEWTLVSLDEDHELEEFLDGIPGLFHPSTRRHFPELKNALESTLKPVTDRLLATCSSGLLPEPVRRQRLAACLGAIWCFPDSIERHFNAVWSQWTETEEVTNDPWGPLTTETWAMAANMTTDSNPLTALRAHCIQALTAIMRRYGRWHCSASEASALLQRQLGVSSTVIEKYLQGDRLQLAVAANLLSKVELKAILDTMCRGLDASDIPEDLRARFVDAVEVMKVFYVQDVPRNPRRRRRAAFDMNGPWTKIFTSSTQGQSEEHRMSELPPVLPQRLSREIET
ncbi:hypothetical protein B0F90DRAFT_1736076 [Multifurca ochricompacta]|uniref:DUF6535 domain-containing protein n=1 Tax=Multifurca ochricompacta TaxID=376703 RepID=A0AAD4M1M9_9AGAM|nr:hypothetical protein B0F90DRAFT_1736076 [Multifurca ochricompacta]